MVLPELEEIRKRRQRLDLTQQELAEKTIGAGSRVVINHIEKRNTSKLKMYSPSYDDVKCIFDYLEKEERDHAVNVSSGKSAGEICNWNGKMDLRKVNYRNKIEFAKTKMGSDGQITQLPVLKERECIGLITQKSMLENPKASHVEDAMISKPVTIDEDMEITPGLIDMLATPQSCILVSKRNSSEIMGIIVAWDLIPKKGKK